MLDSLIKILEKIDYVFDDGKRPIKDNIEFVANFLLENNVIATPCVAMVEQFIKDGKIDKRLCAHNGKYAVVYIDKSKWQSPLIDITEQFYNDEKAKERIRDLMEAQNNGV